MNWKHSEHLDALKAAPNHHLLIFENEDVRILDTKVTPGDKVPLHTHRWPSIYYVISFSHFIRYDNEGNVNLDSRTSDEITPETKHFTGHPSHPHTLENVGETDLHIIAVELKKSKIN
jgi:hypothetical protein